MVYCTKCGVNNSGKNAFCINCGARLYGVNAEGEFYWRHRHRTDNYYNFHRRRGSLTTLIVGIATAFIGFNLLLNEAFNNNYPVVGNYPDSHRHLVDSTCNSENEAS